MRTQRMRQAFTDLAGVRELGTVVAAALLFIASGMALTSVTPAHAASDAEESEVVAGSSTDSEIEDVRNEIKFQEYNWNSETGEVMATGDQSSADQNNPRGYLDGFESRRNEIRFLEANPNFHPDDLVTNPLSKVDQSGNDSSTVWPGIRDLDLVSEPRLHHLPPPETDTASN